MANPISVPQNFSTTLNAAGGITNSQTTGIVLTSVTNLPTDGGILCFDWAATLDTAVAEYIEYTGITGNELTGVTRGVEGVSAKAHTNGCTVVGVISQAHIKRLRDKLTGNDAVALQDPSANEILKTSYVASAVNEITITNAATANSPSVAATGVDTNIDLNLKGKGTGVVKAWNGSSYIAIPLSASMLSTTQYAPQGFLLNGKIVPSVASNNLTVAIKGMDGNDPSAANPVYCRIGDTVRTITAALSVTKNAGTNWCNAGGSELATQEIDYFVYLGYNATDGVTIGFARIPYATKYSDFSTTTTADLYCAISTISNAAANDYYELIGRFAATLSAGAGYTWTVPTFTANNLIQRPIFETRKLVWVPQLSAAGSMTYTSTVVNQADYILSGRQCFMRIYVTGTTGGSVSNVLLFTQPIPRSTTLAYEQFGVGQGNDTTPCTMLFGASNTSQTQVQVTKSDNTTFGAGANRYYLGPLYYLI